MRCYICNRVIDDPQFNQDHRDIDPCDMCKAIIEDTLSGFADQPDFDEDSDLLILEGIYPVIYDPFGTEDT